MPRLTFEPLPHRAPPISTICRKLVRFEMARIVALQELGVFEPGPCVEDNDLVVFADPAVAGRMDMTRN